MISLRRLHRGRTVGSSCGLIGLGITMISALKKEASLLSTWMVDDIQRRLTFFKRTETTWKTR